MFPYKAGRPFRYDPAAKKGKTPPACPGEYRIRNARRELQYIGETNDLSRRMKEHIASGKLRWTAACSTTCPPMAARLPAPAARTSSARSKSTPPGNKSRGAKAAPPAAARAAHPNRMTAPRRRKRRRGFFVGIKGSGR